ncbi:MAG TPA: glycosyltransferase [Puia sp.]
MTFSPENPGENPNGFMTNSSHPTQGKLIIATVISDLATDYRVHRICQTLREAGYRVLLTGSVRRNSLRLEKRDYQTDRLKLWFNRTALFYAEFNIRLFFRLLFKRGDIYLGNDLDVMPATRLLAWLHKKPLVYDSHEYFLGMAGMDQKPFRRGIWKFIERRLFRRLKYAYTVCDSIQALYRQDYDKTLSVVRNLPLLEISPGASGSGEKDRIHSIDRQIPPGKWLLLLQGAGINTQRGAEELVLSMLFLDEARFHLLIIGGGDIFPDLQKIVAQNKLQSKVSLVSRVPFALLNHFTRQAHLGLSIDKPSVINHRYSLPNKLFEYLHAGVPVLASRLVEQEKIINHYQVGTFIENHQPEHIAQKIREIFENQDQLNYWKENTRLVRKELNWENESKIIIDIFKQVETDSVT